MAARAVISELKNHMTPMDDLRIVFYRGASGQTILAQDYRQLDPAGKMAMAVDVGGISLSIIVGGRERLAPFLSLGSLAEMIPQLEAAGDRLGAGKPALIRSGVLDEDPGLYLLFDPHDDDDVHVSLLAIHGIGNFFPVPPGSRDAKAIYRYVASHRDDCIEAAREWYDLTRLRMNKSTLLAAFPREAEIGRAVLTERSIAI